MTNRLPSLPTIKDILQLYNLQASKQLSQNFLLNLHITDKIVKNCFAPTKSKTPKIFAPTVQEASTTVIEVGPGPGPLSRSLLNSDHVKNVIAVEKDDRFLPALQLLSQASNDRFKLVQGDILEVDEEELLMHYGIDNVCRSEEEWRGTLSDNVDPRVVLVGNLPFGIATPLLIKWLRDLSDKTGAFKYGRVPMVLMFQKEVGQRICAKHSTKPYGRLSVISQNLCRVTESFIVKGKSFVPPPKVDASVVRLEPREEPLEPELPMKDLEQFCHLLFNSRRKQVYVNLRTQLTDPECKQLISTCTKKDIIQKQEEENNQSILDQRPEHLSVDVVCHLAKQFYDLRRKNMII